MSRYCDCCTGPSVTSLDDIKSIVRKREPPLTGAMCDLLWADPLLEEVLGYALKDSEYEEVSVTIAECCCYYG